MAGEKVGVKVSQEDVADLELMLRGECKILIDVSLGIDDQSLRQLLATSSQWLGQ